MIASNLSTTLELFFIDGKPDGMLTAEVFNCPVRGQAPAIPALLFS